MATALTLKNASRLNPIVEDTDAPAAEWVAIDTTGNTVDSGSSRNDIMLYVINTEANIMTVTQTVYATVAGIIVPNETYAIGVGETGIIGPINHNSLLSNGIATFAFSSSGTPTGYIMAMKVDASDV